MKSVLTTLFFTLLLCSLLSPLPLVSATQGEKIYIGLAYYNANQNTHLIHEVVAVGLNCSFKFTFEPIFMNDVKHYVYISYPFLRFKSIIDISSAGANTTIISYVKEDVVLYAIITSCSVNTVTVRVNNVEIIGALLVETTLEELRETKRGFNVGGFFKAIGDFFSFIGNAFSVFVEMIKVSGTIITNTLVEGFRFLATIIGKPGDPLAQFYSSLYKLSLQQHVNNPYIGESVRGVLDCKLKLREVSGLIGAHRQEDLDKTLCDLENSAPQGIVGFLSVIWFTLSTSSKIIELIARNFVLINAVVILSIIVFGVTETIRRRSLEPLQSSIHMIYSVFKFYFMIGKFIYEAGLKLIEAIASLIEAVLPF